jgi:hypothetical protein
MTDDYIKNLRGMEQYATASDRRVVMLQMVLGLCTAVGLSSAVLYVITGLMIALGFARTPMPAWTIYLGAAGFITKIAGIITTRWASPLKDFLKARPNFAKRRLYRRLAIALYFGLFALIGKHWALWVLFVFMFMLIGTVPAYRVMLSFRGQIRFQRSQPGTPQE